jgi:acetyl-CoA carboxylase carboxyltransferase component
VLGETLGAGERVVRPRENWCAVLLTMMPATTVITMGTNTAAKMIHNRRRLKVRGADVPGTEVPSLNGGGGGTAGPGGYG